MKKTSLCLLITVLSSGVFGQVPLRWNYPCKPGLNAGTRLHLSRNGRTPCQITGIDLSTFEYRRVAADHDGASVFSELHRTRQSRRGFGFPLEGFNGFLEFKRRPDAMKALRETYFREDFNTIRSLSDSAQMGAYSLKWIGAELIMGDETLLNQMSSSEKVDSLKCLYTQLLVKQKYADIFGGISDAVSVYIFYKVMKTLDVNVLENTLNQQSVDQFRNRLIVRNVSELRALLAKI